MTLEGYTGMAERFEARTLDAREFSHVDHIGVACHMLRKYPFLDAAQKYGAALQAIATEAGVPEKFNTTLTLAFLGVLAERMADTPHESFDDFLEKNPDLRSRALMKTWYSDDRIASEQARGSFLMPDRFRD
ncbi:hypothetical protein [Roseibium aggregatum]|uniref:Uncharacterized protein n=1 Tax=Roseibium aggregatum TaxID=187304 RepID=A0A939EI20_9HYPH|nr:hypothetical protein [Roseibium aggregatum]MBN9672817.1 hypothetical protein [Roseibium aggregatum]